MFSKKYMRKREEKSFNLRCCPFCPFWPCRSGKVSGIRLQKRSTLSPSLAICSSRTFPFSITKKAFGVTEIPAPPPPPKRSFWLLLGKSDPPEAYPTESFDTGIITVSSETVIGFPMTVSASHSSRTFSSVAPIRPKMGCSLMFFSLLFLFFSFYQEMHRPVSVDRAAADAGKRAR